MNWRDHIHSDPKIGFGKPIFRGTRIKVEFVLKLMAAGWTAEQMADEYPGIRTGSFARRCGLCSRDDAR